MKKVSFQDYVRAIGSDRGAKKRIAFVVGEGAIARGQGEDAMGTDEGFTSGAFIKMLRSGQRAIRTSPVSYCESIHQVAMPLRPMKCSVRFAC